MRVWKVCLIDLRDRVVSEIRLVQAPDPRQAFKMGEKLFEQTAEDKLVVEEILFENGVSDTIFQ